MTNKTPLENLRVLIVEDEFFLADDLARALRNAGSEPLGPVATVAEADELLRSRSVDAAIVDLNLHGTMASDFVSRVAVSGLPCLIVSGYAGTALPQSLSHVPRLEKPVNPASVLQALAKELVAAHLASSDRPRSQEA